LFYVYKLIDPRNKQPFYIGKGQGQRLHHHEQEARRGKKSRKCNLIREIWEQQLEIQKEIVKEFDDEIAAYNYEADLINLIGLKNLTNEIPGGFALAYGRTRSKSVTDRENRKMLDFFLPVIDKFDRWKANGYVPYFRVDNGHELAAEFEQSVRKTVDTLRDKLNIVAWINLPLGKPPPITVKTIELELAH